MLTVSSMPVLSEMNYDPTLEFEKPDDGQNELWAFPWGVGGGR